MCPHGSTGPLLLDKAPLQLRNCVPSLMSVQGRPALVSRNYESLLSGNFCLPTPSLMTPQKLNIATKVSKLPEAFYGNLKDSCRPIGFLDVTIYRVVTSGFSGNMRDRPPHEVQNEPESLMSSTREILESICEAVATHITACGHCIGSFFAADSNIVHSRSPHQRSSLIETHIEPGHDYNCPCGFD
jgi:hypothetical protein